MLQSINEINKTQYLYNVKLKNNRNFSPAFKGLEEDTFEVKNKTKPVKIQDISGRSVDAVIEDSDFVYSDIFSDDKKFSIIVNGQELGFALVRDNDQKTALDLFSLHTEDYDNKTYRGAGTELLKCAVNESMKRGYNGRIETWASNSKYSPLAFYYKENFIVPSFSKYAPESFNQKHNAAIEYAISNNIPVQDVLPFSYRKGHMLLDEEGAKALLEEKRLYEDRTFEKIEQKNIDGVNYSANFIQSPLDSEYFIFIANEDAKTQKAEFVATVREKENENGVKHFILCDMFSYGDNKKNDSDFALDTAEKISRDKGFEQPTVAKTLNNDSRFLYENSNALLQQEKTSFLNSILGKIKEILT